MPILCRYVPVSASRARSVTHSQLPNLYRQPIPFRQGLFLGCFRYNMRHEMSRETEVIYGT